MDTKALDRLANTSLGNNLLITNRDEWSEDRIISAYRSQFLLEGVFKQTKDRRIGSWWPLNHWTDSKIRVHALYCTVATLLRGLLLRRVRRQGLDLSMKRLLGELGNIREVINVYPRKRGQRTPRQQTVLTRTSDLQDRLLSILALHRPPERVLG